MSAEQNAGDEPAENGGQEDDVVDITGIVERIGPMEEIVANLKSSGEATKARLSSVVNSMKEALAELDVVGRKVIDSMLKEGELTTKAEEKKTKFDELLASKLEAIKQRDEAQNLLDQFLHARKLTVEAEGILAADMERLEPEKAKYLAKLERAKRKNDEYKDEISDKQLEVKEVKSKISKFKTCFDLLKRFCDRAGADETAFPDIYFLDDYKPVSTRALDTWVSAKKAKQRRVLEQSSGSRLTPSRSGLSQQLNFSNELSPAVSSRSIRSRAGSTSSEEEAPSEKRPPTEKSSTSLRASSQESVASSKKEVKRKPPVQKKRGRPPVAAGRKVSVSRRQKKPVDTSDVDSEEEKPPARLKAPQKKPVVEATNSSGAKGEEEREASVKLTTVVEKRQPVVESSDSSDEESEKEGVPDRLNASGKGELFGSSDTSDEDEEKGIETIAKPLEFPFLDFSETINKEIEEGKAQQEKPVVESSDVEEEKEEKRREQSLTVDKKQPVVESSDSSEEECEKEAVPVPLKTSEKASTDSSEEEKEGKASAKLTSVVEKKQPVGKSSEEKEESAKLTSVIKNQQPVVESSDSSEEESEKDETPGRLKTSEKASTDSSEEEKEEGSANLTPFVEKKQPVVESSDSSEEEKPPQSKQIPGKSADVSGEGDDISSKPAVAEKKRPAVGLSSASEEEEEEEKESTKLANFAEKKQPVAELSEEKASESEPLPGKAAVSTDSSVGKEKEEESEPKTSPVPEKQSVVESKDKEAKTARKNQPGRRKVVPRNLPGKRKAAALSSNDSSDSESERPPAKRKPPSAQVTEKKAENEVVTPSKSSESDKPADEKKRRKRPRDSSSEEVETEKPVAEEKSPDFRAKPRRSPRVKPTPTQEDKTKPNQKKGKMWSHASMDLSLAFAEDADADYGDDQPQPQQQQSFPGNNLGITVNVGDDFGLGAVFGNDLHASSISMPNLEDILSSIKEDDNTGAVPTVAQMVQQQPPAALNPPVEQSSFDVDAHIASVATAAGFDSNVQEQQTWPQLAPQPAVPATPLPTQGNVPSPGFLRRSPRFQKTNGQVPSPGGVSDGAKSAPKKEKKPEKKSLFGLSSSDEDEEEPSPPRQPTQQLPPTTNDRNLSDSSSGDENPSAPAKPSTAPKIADQRPPTPDKMSHLAISAVAEATKRRISSPSPPPQARPGSSSSGGQGSPSPASSMSRSPSPGPPGGLGLAGRGLGMRGRTLSRGEPPAAAGRGRGRPLAAARHSGMGAEVKVTGPGTPNWKRSFECRTRNSGGENTRLAKMLTGPGGFDVTAALEKKLHGPRPTEAGPRAFTPSPMGMAGPSRGPSPRFPPPRPPGPVRHPRPPMPRQPFQGHPPRGRPPLPPQHRPVRPTMSEDPFVRKASRSRIVAKRPQRSDQEEHAESTADEAEAHKPAAIVPMIRVVTPPPPPPTKASASPKASPLKEVVKPPANVLKHDLSLSDSDSDGEGSETSPEKQPPPSPVSSVSSGSSSADTSKEIMSDSVAETQDGDKPGPAQTTPHVGLRDRTPTPTRLARVEVSGGISFQFPVLPFLEPGPGGDGPAVVTTESKPGEDSEDDEGRLIMNVDQAGSVPTGAPGESKARKRKASANAVKVDSEKKSKFMADVFGGVVSDDDEEEEAGQLQVQEEEEAESTGNAKTPEFQLPSDNPASSQESSDDDDGRKWVIAEASEDEAPKTPVPVATVSFNGAAGAFITFPAVPPEPAAQQQQPAVQFYSKPAGGQVESRAEASGGLRLGEETSSEGRLLKIFKACAAGKYPSGTDFTMAKDTVWSNLGAPVFIETLAKSLNDIESDMMLSCQLVVKYDPSIYPKEVVNLAQGLLSFGLPTEDIHQKVVIRLLKRQKPAIERAVNVGSILAFILICSHFWPFPPNLLKEFFLYALQSSAWKIGHTVMCLKIMSASGAANDKFLRVICGHLSARRLKSSVCIGCSSVKNGKCRFLWDNDKEFGDFPLSLLQAVSFKRLTHEERKLVAGILRGIKQEAQMTGKEKKGWELIECLMFREA